MQMFLDFLTVDQYILHSNRSLFFLHNFISNMGAT